ncbi:igLON family member 5, partial [Gracilinanus agilis]|uniref:igLON family member 5 n=1 Tax=Gracilinanus agilis TaxID=191870 RepID=UPI001CFF2F24
LLSQSLEFSSLADNYTVCEGDNATLSCSIDEHVTRVAWLNRSNILYAGNDRWTSDPRVRLLTNSPAEFSILITRVGLGDEGLYTCSFQTRQQPHTAQVYLIVHVPARIVNISSAVTVNEGGNVNLLCLAVGRPEPTVTWRQLRDGFTSEGEILEISDIRRSQAGDYECVTHNGVASAPDSRRVPVTVNYPPTITDVTSARTAVGRTALLRCEAMAVPPADFQWFKDDKQLGGGAAEGLKVQTERTRSMLLFANVSGRHYGNYTCRAANRLGAASASMRLLRPGSLENAASRPPGPLALLSALGWLCPGLDPLWVPPSPLPATGCLSPLHASFRWLHWLQGSLALTTRLNSAVYLGERPCPVPPRAAWCFHATVRLVAVASPASAVCLSAPALPHCPLSCLPVPLPCPLAAGCLSSRHCGLGLKPSQPTVPHLHMPTPTSDCDQQ